MNEERPNSRGTFVHNREGIYQRFSARIRFLSTLEYSRVESNVSCSLPFALDSVFVVLFQECS